MKQFWLSSVAGDLHKRIRDQKGTPFKEEVGRLAAAFTSLKKVVRWTCSRKAVRWTLSTTPSMSIWALERQIVAMISTLEYARELRISILARDMSVIHCFSKARISIFIAGVSLLQLTFLLRACRSSVALKAVLPTGSCMQYADERAIFACARRQGR